MSRGKRRKLSGLAVTTALLLSAMWGLNIVGIKVALETFPPIWNAFWRLWLAPAECASSRNPGKPGPWCYWVFSSPFKSSC